jgi:hypothetical protein
LIAVQNEIKIIQKIPLLTIRIVVQDGNVLLHEMQIQHPTASLIARASTAQVRLTYFLLGY